MRLCSVCRRFQTSADPHCPRDGAKSQDEAAPEFSQASTVFGRFEIGEPLARGGTGTIYRAREASGGQVALKVLHAELTQNPIDRSRIKRELSKASSVNHPHIVRVREVGEYQGRIFVVRDYVEGDPVASVLRIEGAFDLGRTATILRAAAAALIEAHKIGVLHRDLNPRHVLIAASGGVQLLDFSLSAPIAGGILGKPATGSIAYLSPEQASGRIVTLRADLYGLGLLFHEMLTGHPLGEAGDAAAMIGQRSQATPPPAPPGLPDDVALLLAQLLARDPKDRPFGARQVEKVLAPYAVDVAGEATDVNVQLPLESPLRPPRRGAAMPFATTPLPPGAAAGAAVSGLPPTGALPMGEPTKPFVALPPPRSASDRLDLGGPPRAAIEIQGKRVAAQATSARRPVPEPHDDSKASAGERRPVAAKRTLVGVALPASLAPADERQAWARSVLGLPEDKTPAPPLSRDGTVPEGRVAPLPGGFDDAEVTDRAPHAVMELLGHDKMLTASPAAPWTAPDALGPDDEPQRPSMAELEAAAEALAGALPPPTPHVEVDEGASPPPAHAQEPVSFWGASEPPVAISRASSAASRRWLLGAAIGVFVVLVAVAATSILGRRQEEVLRVPQPAVSPVPPEPPARHPALVPVAAQLGTVRPTAEPVPGTVADAGSVPSPSGPSSGVAAGPADAAVPPPEIATGAVPATPSRAVDSDPRTTEQIIKAGRAHIRRRRWQEAGGEFERALAREPSSLDAVLGIAQVQMALHRYAEAADTFRRALALRPTSSTFHVYLGNALSAAGERAAAREAWQGALGIDPRNLEARQRLGLLRRAPGRPQKARQTRTSVPTKRTTGASGRTPPRSNVPSRTLQQRGGTKNTGVIRRAPF